MSKQQLERLEVTMTSNQKDDNSTDFSVKVDAVCSLAFMAVSFKALMKEDENIRKAMHIAVLDEVLQMFEKEQGKNVSSDLEDMLKNKIYAQA